jgi:hypothetical protein
MVVKDLTETNGVVDHTIERRKKFPARYGASG